MPFCTINTQKILANLVFQLGHFVPKSFAQLLYSTIMLQSGNETNGGSHFSVKVCSENNFDNFLTERPP